eukprot:1647017-Pleurochrysis_carterae.AAC.1
MMKNATVLMAAGTRSEAPTPKKICCAHPGPMLANAAYIIVIRMSEAVSSTTWGSSTKEPAMAWRSETRTVASDAAMRAMRATATRAQHRASTLRPAPS